MSPVCYFSSDIHEKISGSDFGEPNDKLHWLELSLYDGHMYLQVKIDGSRDVFELMLSDDQAQAFAKGVANCMSLIESQKRN